MLAVALAAEAWARPPSIGSRDAEAHPIRCHWERAEDEGRCATVLQYAVRAWDEQVDRIGFAAPLPDAGLGGSDALDIYLGVSETSGAGEAWVDCDGGDGTCADVDPTDGRAAAPAYVVIDARTRDAVLPAYTVHEFNHVLQYATDYAEPFLSVWEGTAVASEMWTLPDVDPSADDVGDYQSTPWMSAVLQDGYFLWDEAEIESWYEYGAMVWVRWMDDRYGDGAGSIAPLLWEAMTQEGMEDEPDVLDAWTSIAGFPWQDGMLDFAADRARMGTDEGPDWLDFAGEQGVVARAMDWPHTGDLTSAEPLYPLGAAYFDVALEPGVYTLHFTLDADPATLWGVVIVEEGGPTEIFYGSSGELPLDVTGRATVGVVNVGPPHLDADDPLEAATFTLHLEAEVTGSDDEQFSIGGRPGCACDTPGNADSAWILGALAALGARRRRSLGACRA